MAKLTVHAGDWAKGDAAFSIGKFELRFPGAVFPEIISADRLVDVQVASEENVKRIGSAAGWATVGALALGPLGLVAGLAMGGNRKDVTFIAEFADGRRLLATTDSRSFADIRAAAFDGAGRVADKEAVPEVLRPYVDIYGFTLAEAREYRGLLMDETKSEQASAMRQTAMRRQAGA